MSFNSFKVTFVCPGIKFIFSSQCLSKAFDLYLNRNLRGAQLIPCVTACSKLHFYLCICTTWVQSSDIVNMEIFFKNPKLDYTRYFLRIASMAGRNVCIFDFGLRQTWPGERSLESSVSLSWDRRSWQHSHVGVDVFSPVHSPSRRQRCLGAFWATWPCMGQTPACPEKYLLWPRPKVCPHFSGEENSILWSGGDWNETSVFWQLRHQMWMSDIHNTQNCKFSFVAMDRKYKAIFLKFDPLLDQPAK